MRIFSLQTLKVWAYFINKLLKKIEDDLGTNKIK